MFDAKLAPWANEIPDGMFVSEGPSYPVGEFFHLYEEDTYLTETKGEMKYYFYDPMKHGFPIRDDYPLLLFLHGSGNALQGDICINYSGAELYASPDYQEDFGGAYILIPLANEYRDEEGKTQGFWTEDYTDALYGLVNDFIARHTNGVGKKVVLGNSSGATMAFCMVNHYTSFFQALVPVGSASIPDDETLNRYEENDVHLFYAIGKRDEFHSFRDEVAPRLPRLERMKHCFVYTPEWVRNEDGGIASINVGIEMGQHCLVNPMHANLMFQDGTPMEERLPGGVTGWLRDLFVIKGKISDEGY